jgi:hypothetical protein
MHNSQLLVVMVPEDMRDDIIDVLIGCVGISGFNMQSIAGYSREHSQYDLREQVQGHRQLCKFEVLHEPEQQAQLLAALRPASSATHIRYWILPVMEEGRL